MEKSLGSRRGRIVPVLVVACLGAAFVPAQGARAGTAAQRTTNGWPTQDWPQGGQDSGQPRCIETAFTTAQYYPSTGPAATPASSLAVFYDVAISGNSCNNTNSCNWVDPLGGVVSGPGLDNEYHPIVGEVATAECAATSDIGPQGVAVALSEEGILVFPSPAAWTSYGSYNTRFLNRPGGVYDFVGTPVVVGSSTSTTSRGSNRTGSFTIYAAANHHSGDDPNVTAPHILAQQVNVSYSVATGGGPGGMTKSVELNGGSWRSNWRSGGQQTDHGPTLNQGTLYFGTRAQRIPGLGALVDRYNPGSIYAVNPDDFSGRWQKTLTLGPGQTTPGPRGQVPPALNEHYGAVTPVAVANSIAVVGCDGVDDWGASKHALFAYNTLDGSLRWVAKVDDQIMPAPAFVGEIVIFGTKNGRAYAVNTSDGTFRWQISSNARLRYRTQPFNSPEQYANVALYGPAVNAAGTVALFGGSDGGITWFSSASGDMGNTGSFLYHSAGYSDGNGRLVLKPLTMNCAPVMFGNQSIVFKLSTTNDSDWNSNNGSFLLPVSLSDAGGNSGFNPAWSVIGLTFDANAGCLRQGTTRIDFVSLNGSMGWNFDLIRQVPYIDWPGQGYSLQAGEGDTGGLSLGSGYLFATDKAGHVAMVPATDRFVAPPYTGSTGPYPPPDPGPTPDLPGGLGPIVVYPNPFNPATAVGGVAKFRNLPDGTFVELYTLAYERVRVLGSVNHRAEWDGRNEAGQPAATGVYLYRIVLPDDVPPVKGRLALIRR